jgi:hypothetical protein
VRIVTKDAKYGFQAGEVSMAFWNHRASMEKLPVEFLDIFEVVHACRCPIGDGLEIFLLFLRSEPHCLHSEVPPEPSEREGCGEGNILLCLPGDAQIS